MNLSRLAKNVLKRGLGRYGYEIYRRPYLPKGTDVYLSLRAHWPRWQPEIIFDVGANVGQTIARARPLFPRARIHAFEPVPDTCSQLRRTTSSDPLVHCHELALADRAGESWLQLHESSDHNSLVPALRGTDGSLGREVKITLETAAGFCARHQIQRINLLKIDVEGFELSVLRGAEPLLDGRAIDFIIVEAGLVTDNPRFTPLPALVEFLRPYGFWPVGVYEQFGQRYQEIAEFCNVLFAHERHLSRGSGWSNH